MKVSGVRGVQAFIRAIRDHKKSSGKKMERGLLRAGLALQAFSQMLAPVDTGAMKNSARTTKKGSGFDAVVTVKYLVDYAIHVHERDDLHHDIGQAHFLSDAVIDNEETLRYIVKEEMSS